MEELTTKNELGFRRWLQTKDEQSGDLKLLIGNGARERGRPKPDYVKQQADEDGPFSECDDQKDQTDDEDPTSEEDVGDNTACAA